MKTQDKTTLKPCPFCDSAAFLSRQILFSGATARIECKNSCCAAILSVYKTSREISDNFDDNIANKRKEEYGLHWTDNHGLDWTENLVTIKWNSRHE